jgi:hypothetical protein
MARLAEHYEEAKEYLTEDRIVGIFIQGSQNYGLDYEGSDIDTKLIIAPTFEEIAFNKRPLSTTHVRANNEHIDFKDIRLYIETFRKQNLNFLEILFTKYKIVNPMYEQFWNQLVAAREDIAHYDLRRAIKSMQGIALEKYHAMEHKYPSKIEIIEKYGYDSKQLHHLLRVENYLKRYINGEKYENCLIPSPSVVDLLKGVKEDNGFYSLEEARMVADKSLNHIVAMCSDFLVKTPEGQNAQVDDLLNKVQYEIMKTSTYNHSDLKVKKKGAENIIYQCMLLTGTRVGEFFKKNNYPCLFRVLSLDKETDQRTSEMIDLLLEGNEGSNLEKISHLVDSIYPKGRYDTEGRHDGLDLDYYCHCTSSLRRAQDILIEHALEVCYDQEPTEEELAELREEIEKRKAQINSRNKPIDWFAQEYNRTYQKRRH